MVPSPVSANQLTTRRPLTNPIDLSLTRCSGGDKQHLDSSDESEMDAPVSMLHHQGKGSSNSTTSVTSGGQNNNNNATSLNLNSATATSRVTEVGGATHITAQHMQSTAHQIPGIMGSHANSSSSNSTTAAGLMGLLPQHYSQSSSQSPHHQQLHAHGHSEGATASGKLMSQMPPLSAVAAYSHLHSVMGSSWSDYQHL